MDDKTKSTLIGTFIGSLASSLISIGGCFIYNTVKKKSEKNVTLEDQLKDAQEKLEIYTDMCVNLKAESNKITATITENTMNVSDLQKFNAAEYRDRLITVNDAWREAASKKKFYQEYIKSLIEKVQSKK